MLIRAGTVTTIGSGWGHVGPNEGEVLVICPPKMLVDPAEMKNQVLFSAVRNRVEVVFAD